MFYDSLEFYNSIKQEEPKPTKKEDSIISNKILVIFGIVAVIKIAILLML